MELPQYQDYMAVAVFSQVPLWLLCHEPRWSDKTSANMPTGKGVPFQIFASDPTRLWPSHCLWSCWNILRKKRSLCCYCVNGRLHQQTNGHMDSHRQWTTLRQNLMMMTSYNWWHRDDNVIAWRRDLTVKVLVK